MNTMYQCEDGTWLILSSHNPATWLQFCDLLDHPELADNHRFDTPYKRFANAQELIAISDELSGSHPVEHWVPRLKATSRPAPEVGEHTGAVLAELDRSPQQITQLSEAGVVVTTVPREQS